MEIMLIERLIGVRTEHELQHGGKSRSFEMSLQLQYQRGQPPDAIIAALAANLLKNIRNNFSRGFQKLIHPSLSDLEPKLEQEKCSCVYCHSL